MTRTSQLVAWMSRDEVRDWVTTAESKGEYQRRLVIWIVTDHPMPATEVARILGISKQAVWKWISEYNRMGPRGLDRPGRGGRRRALFPLTVEQSLVESLRRLQARNPQPSIRSLVPLATRILGQRVSVDYLYRLLRRWPQKE